MIETANTTHVAQLPLLPHPPMVLDLAAVEAAGRGTETPEDILWRSDILALLDASLATELVCGLRYRRHHFTARGLASPKIAEEFLVHAAEEAVHADRLAARIVQLGGSPDFSPETILRRSHAAYDDSRDLTSMIEADLLAERIAIECYSQMVILVGNKDATTRRLLEDILGEEQKHAEELSGWLTE